MEKDLRERFKEKIELRKVESTNYYHLFNTQMLQNMCVGEELVYDIWLVVRIHNGWIINRHGFGQVFVPETI